MKRFLVVQHTYSEFLGGIEKQLENRGIGFIYTRPFTGQSLPASALQYNALWLLGAAYAARAEWPETQRTTDRVAATLVAALDPMRERRKPPVFLLNPVRPGE